jgi:hypothetical protein
MAFLASTNQEPPCFPSSSEREPTWTRNYLIAFADQTVQSKSKSCAQSERVASGHSTHQLSIRGLGIFEILRLASETRQVLISQVLVRYGAQSTESSILRKSRKGTL